LQGGYGALFAVMVQILLSITRVAPKALTEAKQASGVQAWSEPVVSSGAEVYLRALVRDHGLSFITLLSREAVVKSKNRDKFINSTVRSCCFFSNKSILKLINFTSFEHPEC